MEVLQCLKYTNQVPIQLNIIHPTHAHFRKWLLFEDNQV